MIKKTLYNNTSKNDQQGYKKKNLRLINGKSLVNITISQAIKLNPQRIFVSSEK